MTTTVMIYPYFDWILTSSCFDWLAPAFDDSNEKDVHLDDPFMLLDNSDEGPGSMDQHSSPVIISYPPPLPPFDMVDIVHNASSCGMHEV